MGIKTDWVAHKYTPDFVYIIEKHLIYEFSFFIREKNELLFICYIFLWLITIFTKDLRRLKGHLTAERK